MEDYSSQLELNVVNLLVLCKVRDYQVCSNLCYSVIRAIPLPFWPPTGCLTLPSWSRLPHSTPNIRPSVSSWKFPLRWEDCGDPKEGEPSSLSEESVAPFNDSGMGSSQVLSTVEGGESIPQDKQVEKLPCVVCRGGGVLEIRNFVALIYGSKYKLS